MPDYLAISVGDGCTIAGVWKGLKDLYAIGFIDKLPRLISAQSTGCYPLNRAIQENKPWSLWRKTRLPTPFPSVCRATPIRRSWLSASRTALPSTSRTKRFSPRRSCLAEPAACSASPAGVTGTAAVKKACELGLIGKNDTVVSVVTGNGLKDVANAIKSAGEPINIKPDLDLMVEEFAKRGVTVE